MTGYVRKDTTNNIADGNVINAADLDNEFDGIQDAFNASTGHNHDGTSGEGAPITALGPTQDVTISATLVAPKTTNTVDIGSSALKFKDLFLAGNGSVGGTLAVTGVATFTAQPILSSLTASRAVFSDGSKGLVSNTITGTGNVVMSASPTLTGTVAGASLSLSSLTSGRVSYATTAGLLTDSANMTFNGTTLTVNDLTDSSLTATRVVYAGTAGNLTNSANMTFDGTTLTSTGFAGPLNGTVGATTPTTGAFTTLAASGAVTLSGGTANGVAYLNGSKVVTSGSALTFNGTTQFTYTSSSDAAFDIVASGAGTAGYLGLTNAGSDTQAIGFKNGLRFGSATGTGGAGFSELMRLTSTGLGIGTTSIGERLVVSGSASVDVYKLRSNTSAPASTDAFIYRPADNTIGFGTGSAEKMRLDSSGNLGLGVTPNASWATYKVIQLGEQGILSGFASGAGVLNIGSNFYWDGSGYRYLTTNPASLYQNNAGAHNWRIAASGTAGNAITFTQAMTLDASGNLGIGTSSPAAKLHIKGSSNPAIYWENSTFGSATNAAFMGSAGQLIFGRTGVADWLTIDNSGNLGLGVTPSAWSLSGLQAFQVKNASLYGVGNEGGIYANAYYGSGAWRYIGTAAATGYDFNATGGQHRWFNAPSGTAGNAITFTQAMTLDASGNLEIGGTFSQGRRLNVDSSDDGYTMSILQTGAYNSGKTSGIVFPGYYNGSSITDMASIRGGKENTTSNDYGGKLAFFTRTNGGSDTERARIDSSGNLLVGTTSGSGRVTSQNLGGDAYLAFVNASGSAFSASSGGQSNTMTAAYFTTNYGGVGSITCSSTTAYNTSSDYRLKNTIAPMTGALSKVAQLKPVTYKWNYDNSDGEGFIAHELAEVCPHAVTGEKDAVDADGNPKYQGIDTSFLVATLTAALQEAHGLIKSLEARITALEAK